MTREELNAHARTLGIDPTSYNRKEDLAKAIAEVEATMADAAPPTRKHPWISADHTGRVRP